LQDGFTFCHLRDSQKKFSTIAADSESISLGIEELKQYQPEDSHPFRLRPFSSTYKLQVLCTPLFHQRDPMITPAEAPAWCIFNGGQHKGIPRTSSIRLREISESLDQIV
jgi:hypothetical protein